MNSRTRTKNDVEDHFLKVQNNEDGEDDDDDHDGDDDCDDDGDEVLHQ